ncbi:terminase gpA endonuclease subunit [Aurantimonas sp. 22II-16-19i]|uniref:phage terminase large subunit family protein n=1 Tax=Aurantimonas sp. 22II-16-19i TaxID=1317114 RepID=UPI0009F7C502|nr:terminase gpA endonuclease subunit [Aurantimonas sp. 22II-16-19i]ORE90989.1 terminase GpA [Aurantimonas sp. 22II-16-19i]
MTHLIIETANAERIMWDVMAEVMTPPPPVDYLAWAEANIIFSDRESPFPGPYNRTLFPYFDEILRALGPSDPCRVVTLKKSAQLGGTVLANIFTGGSIAMDPSDILYVHPTEGNAQRWSKMKLAPMLKGTTALAELFPMKSRDGLDSVLYKERVDGRGSIQISGANSPASLSMVTFKRQVQDDLSKGEMNNAGDPEHLANSRSRAHEFAKIFKISTPLVEPGCRITDNFNKGSQERLHLPCPHCDHYQVLEWENMLAVLEEDKPEDAHFTCVECGCEIREHHRPQMLPRGEWRAENPKAKREHRSFDLWSAFSYLQSFERIAREWLDAKGDPASEQTFFNDTLGRAYKTLGEAPPWESLRDRAAAAEYSRGSVPPGALVLTMGIDCQGDRVEWQLVGWGRHKRRWVIEYGVVTGHISEDRCRVILDGLMEQSWRNAYGHRLGIDLAAIDGNAYTEDVWEWAKGWPTSRVIMVRGVGSETAPLISQVKKERTAKGKLLRYSKRFYNFATSILKMSLYRRIVKEDPSELGFIGLPKGLEDEYFRQLTAESRRPKKTKTGFTVYEWVKDASQPNEALDTHLQAEAAAIKLGLRTLPDAIWDRYEAERETPAEDAQLDLEDGLFAPRAEPPQTERAPAPKLASSSFADKLKAWKSR